MRNHVPTVWIFTESSSIIGKRKYGHIVINKAQDGNNNTFFFPSQLADSKNHWIEQITNMDVE